MCVCVLVYKMCFTLQLNISKFICKFVINRPISSKSNYETSNRNTYSYFFMFVF